MEEQSDTPRVDAVLRSFRFIAHTDRAAAMWLDTVINIARDLERELATATRERDEAQAEGVEQARLLGISGSREAALMAKVDAITRERDEARAIANDRDAMVDHRDRALTAMYQRVDVITQERDEARAALRMIADGDLYNADGMRTIACKALAATEAARKFCGVGELERAGYIPAGSADEREAKP